jgi:hypothetical protein
MLHEHVQEHNEAVAAGGGVHGHDVHAAQAFAVQEDQHHHLFLVGVGADLDEAYL